MGSAPDLLHFFVKALALVATSLDLWFPVHWALPIAVFFVPFVGVLDGTVWYLRGMTFPDLLDVDQVARLQPVAYRGRWLVGSDASCRRIGWLSYSASSDAAGQ